MNTTDERVVAKKGRVTVFARLVRGLHLSFYKLEEKRTRCHGYRWEGPVECHDNHGNAWIDPRGYWVHNGSSKIDNNNGRRDR